MAVLIKALLKRPNSATLAIKSWHVITLRYLKENNLLKENNEKIF